MISIFSFIVPCKAVDVSLLRFATVLKLLGSSLDCFRRTTSHDGAFAIVGRRYGAGCPLCTRCSFLVCGAYLYDVNRGIMKHVGSKAAREEVAGGEVAGGEVAGGEVAGGEVAGGEVAGGEVAEDGRWRMVGVGRWLLAPRIIYDYRLLSSMSHTFDCELHIWDVNEGL